MAPVAVFPASLHLGDLMLLRCNKKKILHKYDGRCIVTSAILFFPGCRHGAGNHFNQVL
jgi:hypothetical protein